MGQAVGVGVEGHGELVAGGYFLVYERVQVEYDALQVDYQDLRCFGDARHF